MVPVKTSSRSFWCKACIALVLFGGFATAFVVWFHRPVQIEESVSEFERNALTLRDGRLYPIGGDIPFTGNMIERYEDGSLKSRSEVFDGVLNGLSEGWHTNGVMQVREHFTNAVSHGLREKWFESGNRLSESTIIGGKIEGAFLKWHENGQLAERIEMKQNEPDGIAQAFHPSGFLKTEAKMRQGNLIQSKRWEDGEKEPASAKD